MVTLTAYLENAATVANGKRFTPGQLVLLSALPFSRLLILAAQGAERIQNGSLTRESAALFIAVNDVIADQTYAHAYGMGE